jgi:hypothetical protein
MDIEQINKDFADLVNERGIHKKLGIESYHVRTYRQNIKNGQPISLDLKLKLLQKAERLNQEEEKEYTRADLVNLIKWYNAEGMTHEPDYAVHKFLLQKEETGPAEHINNSVVSVVNKIKDGRNKPIE